MKTVILNAKMQFDIWEDSEDDLKEINEVIDIVNQILSEANLDFYPQIFSNSISKEDFEVYENNDEEL